MKHIEIDTDVRLTALSDQGDRRFEAGTERVGSAEFERQSDIEAGCPLGRLSKGDGSTLQIGRRYLADEIGDDKQGADAELLTDVEAAAKMVEVGLALFSLRKQQ